MRTESKHTTIIIPLIVALLSLCGVAFITQILARETKASTVVFDTDEADHANAAIELYQAISEQNPARIVQALTRQAFYPPVHSIPVAFSYLIAGPSLASSRLPSVFLLVCYGFAVCLLIFKILQKEVGTAETILALSFGLLLGICSPITLQNAVLCMLEIPAMLAVTALMLVAGRTLAPTTKSVVCGALLCLLVMLSKYSFGLVVIPALAAALFFSPGISIKSRFLLPTLAVFIFVLGLACWILSIDAAAFWHFFVGHRAYAPLLSSQHLMFYPRAWLSEYTVHPIISIMVPLFAVIGIAGFWKFLSVRIATCTLIFSFIIFTISRTDEERHILVTAPALWFLSALGLAKLRLQSRLLTQSIQFSVPLFVLIFALFRFVDLPDKLNSSFEGEPTSSALMQFVTSQVDARLPIITNSFSDDFGIEALRWHLAAGNHKYYTEVVAESFPYREDKNKTALKRKRNVDRPFRDRSFPRPNSPFTRVLSQNYYAYAIQLKHLDRKIHFKKQADEFEAALKEFPKTSMSLGNKEVVVYDLRSSRN